MQVATLVDMSSTIQLDKGQTSRSKVIVSVKRHDHVWHVGHLGYVRHIDHQHILITSARLDEEVIVIVHECVSFALQITTVVNE